MAQANIKITIDEETYNQALDMLDEMVERAEKVNSLVSDLTNIDRIFSFILGCATGATVVISILLIL